jgi:hypothetical protein
MNTEHDSPPGLCKSCQYFVFNKLDKTTHRCGIGNWRALKLIDQISFFELPVVSSEGSCDNWTQQNRPNYRSTLIRKLYGHY